MGNVKTSSRSKIRDWAIVTVAGVAILWFADTQCTKRETRLALQQTAQDHTAAMNEAKRSLDQLSEDVLIEAAKARGIDFLHHEDQEWLEARGVVLSELTKRRKRNGQ